MFKLFKGYELYGRWEDEDERKLLGDLSPKREANALPVPMRRKCSQCKLAINLDEPRVVIVPVSLGNQDVVLRTSDLCAVCVRRNALRITPEQAMPSQEGDPLQNWHDAWRKELPRWRKEVEAEGYARECSSQGHQSIDCNFFCVDKIGIVLFFLSLNQQLTENGGAWVCAECSKSDAVEVKNPLVVTDDLSAERHLADESQKSKLDSARASRRDKRMKIAISGAESKLGFLENPTLADEQAAAKPVARAFEKNAPGTEHSVDMITGGFGGGAKGYDKIEEADRAHYARMRGQPLKDYAPKQQESSKTAERDLVSKLLDSNVMLSLKAFEKDVADMYVKGYSQEEIADATKMSRAKVQQTLKDLVARATLLAKQPPSQGAQPPTPRVADPARGSQEWNDAMVEVAKLMQCGRAAHQIRGELRGKLSPTAVSQMVKEIKRAGGSRAFLARH